MSTNYKFGPYSQELTTLLLNFADRGNRDALEVIQSKLRAQAQTPSYAQIRGRYVSDTEALTAFAKKKRRLRHLKALWSSEYIHSVPLLLHTSLGALAMKDLVGKGWLTQKRYSRLMAEIDEFQAIVSTTTQGSPKRSLVCSLMTNGSSLEDALRTADGALLI